AGKFLEKRKERRVDMLIDPSPSDGQDPSKGKFHGIRSAATKSCDSVARSNRH
ncbi:Hypothetical predicted protein, partial [Marmota monax]